MILKRFIERPHGRMSSRGDVWSNLENSLKGERTSSTRHIVYLSFPMACLCLLGVSLAPCCPCSTSQLSHAQRQPMLVGCQPKCRLDTVHARSVPYDTRRTAFLLTSLPFSLTCSSLLRLQTPHASHPSNRNRCLADELSALQIGVLATGYCKWRESPLTPVRQGAVPS